jgi:hypothetical protein
MAELSAHPAFPRTRSLPGQPKKGRLGRKGEAQQATAAGLDLLRVLGWLVLHEVELPGDAGATVDHVLAGPSGVYVVNTVSWSGAISVTDEVLSVGGTNRSESLVEVAGAADLVRGLLGATPVAPLLCFERLEAVVGVAADVALCASENILDLLTSQPQILDTAAVARATHVLVAALRPETTAAGDPEEAEQRARLSVAGPTLDELVRAKAAELHPENVEVPTSAPEAAEATEVAEVPEAPEMRGASEADEAEASAPFPGAVVAEAGAALWRSLTEPAEDVAAPAAGPAVGPVDDVDVEAALAEAAARQREAEESEAQARAERDAAQAEECL